MKIECSTCKGTGQRLAALSKEKDYEYAIAGKPIPKVECWTCNGTGMVEAERKSLT